MQEQVTPLAGAVLPDDDFRDKVASVLDEIAGMQSRLGALLVRVDELIAMEREAA